MIDSKNNPVEWAMLLYELDDAREHLEVMIEGMQDHRFSEEEYRVQIGHVFAHLNRAWNTRNTTGEYTENERSKFSSFPKDLEPCG